MKFCICLLCLCLSVTVFAETVSAEKASVESASEQSDVPVTRGKYTEKHLSLHKPNYALMTWSDKYEAEELVYQISAKFRLFNRDLYLAYTQQSFWQILDTKNSRPFRETNYQPEFFYRLTPGKHHWEFFNKEVDFDIPFGADFGFEHQSNGRSLPDSKSWDRLYIEPYWEFENAHFLSMRLWYRLPERARKDEFDVKGDDNPDILDYYGTGYLQYKYQFPQNNVGISVKLHGNIKTGKGAIEMDVTRPTTVENVFYYLRIFSGYGDSLIDYNQEIHRAGLGIVMQR